MLINIGAAISSFLTPRMKAIDCYPTLNATDPKFVKFFADENKQLAYDSCQIGAFGMSASLMFIALALFLLPPVLVGYYLKNGKKDLAEKFTYKKFEMTNENIMKEVSYATSTAIIGKLIGKKLEEKADEGFLIYSKHHSARIRRASYQVCKLALLYAPIAIFWFLFEQVGSLWVFQAAEMDGWVTKNWYVPADQIGVLNPIMVMLLIPFWTVYMSPMVDKILYKNPQKLKNKPLHMLFVGLLFTLAAGWVTYQLQIKIDDGFTFPDHGKIKQALFKTSDDIKLDLEKLEEHYEWNGNTIYKIPGDETSGETTTVQLESKNQTFILDSKYKNTLYYFYKNDTEIKMHIIPGIPTNQQNKGIVSFYKVDGTTGEVDQIDVEKSNFFNETGNGESKIDLKKFNLFEKYENGGRYLIKSDDTIEQIVASRKVNMGVVVWNYLLLTFGEIMISTTCLEFSYTQAPTQMKTVCTALFYLTITIAHFIDVGLQEFKSYPRSMLMLISCGLLVVDTILYVLIAWSFEVMDVEDVLYLDRPDDSESDEECQKLKLSDQNSDSSENGETKIVDPFRKG